MFSRAVFLALLTLATATIGCGPKAVKRACMSASGGNMLVDGAAMMRLDVYGPSAQCVDGLLADGSGSPLLSHTYVAGQPISLDVPPGPHVLVLTTYADDDSLFPALQAGAHGYLTKDASAEEIERAIRAVADGRTHLDPAIQQRLVASVLSTAPQNPTLSGDLTTRELEVLKLIAAGLSNTEIAAALVVSAATVKTHINHIFQKTGARDRAQAVRYAYQHGLA
jgi:DNA-binding NarL/FixJ family response regulator